MYQAKISLTEPLAEFLSSYEVYGFKDKSSMVRAALAQLQRELELQQLKESAELYAGLYADDAELQEMTETALEEWPE
jgi:Arc/MetJ-type ribon-helix-helix transcriptional regulator